MWSLLYLVVRALVGLLVGAGRAGRVDGSKDLEILVLRHQLRVLLRTYVEHDNRGRPHRALGPAPPRAEAWDPMAVSPRDVRRRDLLGGLIHEYDGAVA